MYVTHVITCTRLYIPRNVQIHVRAHTGIGIYEMWLDRNIHTQAGVEIHVHKEKFAIHIFRQRNTEHNRNAHFLQETQTPESRVSLSSLAALQARPFLAAFQSPLGARVSKTKSEKELRAWTPPPFS